MKRFMDEWKGKRVVVTGAAGFIGSNLIRELITLGAEVHAWIRKPTHLWRIREIQSSLLIHHVELKNFTEVVRSLKKIQAEIIFHLAARQGHPVDPMEKEEALQTNILGTFNLLQAISTIGCQLFVQVGSSLEYRGGERPITEEDPILPSTFRGVTKAAASFLCQQFNKTTDLPLVILRPFSVYGSWEPATRFIPTLILASLRNHEIQLTIPGIRHDFIFVNDLVDACLKTISISAREDEIINIGSGQQWKNEEVVECIENLTGKKIKVKSGLYPQSPSDTSFWVADIQKAKRVLGWKPVHTFTAGLEKTISWFRDHEREYRNIIG